MKSVFCDECVEAQYKDFHAVWENNYCIIYACPNCGAFYLYFRSRKQYLLMQQEYGTIINYIKREVVMEPKRDKARRERK